MQTYILQLAVVKGMESYSAMFGSFTTQEAAVTHAQAIALAQAQAYAKDYEGMQIVQRSYSAADYVKDGFLNYEGDVANAVNVDTVTDGDEVCVHVGDWITLRVCKLHCYTLLATDYSAADMLTRLF
jgi:hypothetical protein